MRKQLSHLRIGHPFLTYMGTTWDKNIACCCHLAGHFLKTCFIDGLAFPSEGALLFDMTLHHMSFTSITRFRTPHPRCFPRRMGGFTDDMSGWIQDHDQMLSACLLAGFRHAAKMLPRAMTRPQRSWKERSTNAYSYSPCTSGMRRVYTDQSFFTLKRKNPKVCITLTPTCLLDAPLCVMTG